MKHKEAGSRVNDRVSPSGHGKKQQPSAISRLRRKSVPADVNAVGMAFMLNNGAKTARLHESIRATGTEGGVVCLILAGRPIRAGALHMGDGRYRVGVGPYNLGVPAQDAPEAGRRIEVYADTRLCRGRSLSEICVHTCSLVDGLTDGIASGWLISSYPAMRLPVASAARPQVVAADRCMEPRAQTFPRFKFEPRFVRWMASKVAPKQTAGVKQA